MTKKQKAILEWALAPTKKGKKKKVKKPPKGFPTGYLANKLYSDLVYKEALRVSTVNKLFTGSVGTYDNVILHDDLPQTGKWIDIKELAKKEKEQYKKALIKYGVSGDEEEGPFFNSADYGVVTLSSYATDTPKPKRKRRLAPARKIETNSVAVAPLPAKRRILRG